MTGLFTIDRIATRNGAIQEMGNPLRQNFFMQFRSKLRTRGPLFRFLAFLRPHILLLLGGSLAGILKFVLPLTFPLAFKYILDVLLDPQPAFGRTDVLIDRWCLTIASTVGIQANASGKLIALVLVLVTVFIVQAVATYYRNYWASTAGHRLIFDVRYALFLHMQNLSHSFFDRTSSGGIVSRFTSDIQLAQNFVGSAMINIWMDGASLGVAIYLLFVLDHRLAWISLCVVPFYVAVIRFLTPRLKDASHSLQEVVEDFSGKLQERVAGVATVKTFAREREEAAHFSKHTKLLYDLTIKNVELSSQHQMLTEFISRCAPLAVLSAGAVMVLHHTTTVGTVVAFYAFVGFLYLPLQRFSELSAIVATSLAAIERLFAFFDERPEIADRADAHQLLVRRGAVSFEHVSFAYHNSQEGQNSRAILHDVSIDIRPGSTVALVGRSGAGKTTLAALLPRFYEPSAGRILIDDVDISGVTLKSLRDNIGLVPQDAVLFSASIRENVKYGKPDASDAQVWRALENANIRDFVESLPNQLDTMIADGGIKPSTGQRQRLALARVFLKDPVILILDEATSGLDSEVENLIHDAVHRLMRGRTSILIAHRLASAVEADKIVVLDHGRVLDTGTHVELSARRGVYRQLYNEQTRKLAPSTGHSRKHRSTPSAPLIESSAAETGTTPTGGARAQATSN